MARRAPKLTRIEQPRGQTLVQMQDELPRACDWGTKCSTQGYKVSWMERLQAAR